MPAVAQGLVKAQTGRCEERPGLYLLGSLHTVDKTPIHKNLFEISIRRFAQVVKISHAFLVSTAGRVSLL